MKAFDFQKTLGVNTHVGSDPYNDPLRIRNMLSYIGMDTIRQSSPIDAASFDRIQSLGRSGVKIDLIVNGGGPVTLDGAMSDVKRLAPHLIAVEGVNEAAIYPIEYKGIKGIDAAVAFQKDLYAAVKQDPTLNGASVYMFTIGGADPSAFPSIGDLSAYTDYANIHSYPPHGLRPIFVIHAAIDGGRTDAPSKPVVITETGYYTLPQNSGWGGVPEGLQAAYLLNLVLDEAKAGVARTYIYDLIDDGADPAGVDRESHFGLFHFDGTPKLSAKAFHNLTTILSDTRSDFKEDGVKFKADGVPYDYTGDVLQLQKSDGVHALVVWNEQQTWDPDKQSSIPVQHHPTKVDLGKVWETVQVFDPLVDEKPLQTYHGVSSVDLDLTDHPLIVQTLPPSAQLSFVDVDGHVLRQNGIKTGFLTTNGLNQTVTQSFVDGVDQISTPTWNSVRTLNIKDASGGSFSAKGFLQTDVSLSHAYGGTLSIYGMKRGSIALDSGDYKVSIGAYSNAKDPAYNRIDVVARSGDDTVVVNGYKDYTVASFTSGSGISEMTFLGAGNAIFVSGTGTTTFHGGSGQNTVEFGRGTTTMYTGSGLDVLNYGLDSGFVVIEGFSLNDRLNIDHSHQSSMHAMVSGSSTILDFGLDHRITLSGITNFDTKGIHWT